VSFDERKPRAADTAWVRELSDRAGASVATVPEILSCWLCHRHNVSNPVTKYTFPQPLSMIRDRIGEMDWAGTDEQLDALVERLSR
jgi:hypothetical protein